MENTTQNALPALIRKVLGSPHSEQVIKAQIIQLAAQNLHVPEVLTALVAILPLTKDKETKDKLVSFLSQLDTSRFTDLQALSDALLELFNTEKDRNIRTALLSRLRDGLHQDQRLAAFFISLSTDESLSEQERLVVQDAISTLPSITEEVALAALLKNVHAPTTLQLQAVELAEQCTVWTDKIVEGLKPYLDVKNDRGIRFRILSRLSEAKLLGNEYVPMLISLLRTDNDATARDKALTALTKIKPWSADVITQLFWSATQDGDDGIRQHALKLQHELPEISNEQLTEMAALLATERSEGVRLTLLNMLKPVMRIREIREAVAAAFSGNPGVFAEDEFNVLTDLLAPYAGRDEYINNQLINSVKGLPNTAQRKKVLSLLINKVKIDTILGPVLYLFEKERDESMREVLFNQIKGLSVSRHPELVEVFCAELTEPGSSFRITCAGILANVAELYPQVVTALEDVLLYDNDRELVRLSMDGYLRPGVEQKFDILLAVVKNEMVDTMSRQKALDSIMKGSIDEQQQNELTDALSGLKPNTLRA
jgi:hypothetical protein